MSSLSSRTVREWEQPPTTKRPDPNDYWYVMHNKKIDMIVERKFHPEYWQEFDLRRGEPRQFQHTDYRYLVEIIRRKNSYRG